MLRTAIPGEEIIGNVVWFDKCENPLVLMDIDYQTLAIHCFAYGIILVLNETDEIYAAGNSEEEIINQLAARDIRYQPKDFTFCDGPVEWGNMPSIEELTC